ncbi:MAG: DUF2147 domain-containing protein [Ginsengibacter sp.]
MKILLMFWCLAVSAPLNAQNKGDAILGKWVSEKGNLILEVYKINTEFRARAVWHNEKVQGNEWIDKNNPDPLLRNRKLLGADMVTQLHYNPNSNRWEDGIIYDPTSGKSWESIAWIPSFGVLKVKGYWLMKIFSKTMTFKRPA